MNENAMIVRMDDQTKADLERMADHSQRSQAAFIRWLIQEAARNDRNRHEANTQPTHQEQPA